MMYGLWTVPEYKVTYEQVTVDLKVLHKKTGFLLQLKKFFKHLVYK